jgi:hypothetical protein
VLTYFKDLDPADPSFHATQYLGTKGFFKDYYARSSEPLEFSQAVEWLRITLPGLQLSPQEDGLLPRRAMQTLFPGPESVWADPRNQNRGADQPVLRGEFCRAIYAHIFRR